MKKPSTTRKIVFQILGGSVAAAFFVTGLLVFFVSWLTKDMPDLCGNTEISTTLIPGTEYKVVVFQRDCGATTGFSTQASIMKTSEELNNEGGNIFSADDNHGAAPACPDGGPELRVRVLSPHALELSYHSGVRVIRAATSYHGIKIHYFQTSNQSTAPPGNLEHSGIRQAEENEL